MSKDIQVRQDVEREGRGTYEWRFTFIYKEGFPYDTIRISDT